MHSVQYTYWQLITALFMCIGNKINYIEIEKKNKIKTKNKSSIPCSPHLTLCNYDRWMVGDQILIAVL